MKSPVTLQVAGGFREVLSPPKAYSDGEELALGAALELLEWLLASRGQAHFHIARLQRDEIIIYTEDVNPALLTNAGITDYPVNADVWWLRFTKTYSNGYTFSLLVEAATRIAFMHGGACSKQVHAYLQQRRQSDRGEPMHPPLRRPS